ncbi:MAG TPA: amidase [Terriglobia bacterium]|nr:amidase [Terriglobia bacterium]
MTARLTRRKFLRAGVMAGVVGSSGTATTPSPAGVALTSTKLSVRPFDLDEITIDALQDGMRSGQFTARSITEKYLARIREIDKGGPALNSVIELNLDAMAIAEEMDRERKAKGSRGPMHGIPVLIKDNIGTHDRMMTTAGSLALLGSVPPRDSFVAQRLRGAGAVILGKTNLSEWANIRSNHSTSGWSGRGGLTRNPYALDRNPCGSSSGSGAATSANLVAVAIGTETDGSIVCPSSVNGIVGIKPTLGLVSRTGIIPIAHSQDTAGPMARTVTDAAILLGALAGLDPEDSATSGSGGKGQADYTRFLDRAGLKGARLGVARKFFGSNAGVLRLMEAALDAMKGEGADIIDPADFETKEKFGDSEFEVLLYELKADMNAYLAKLGAAAPVQSLKQIIDFNEKNKDREMLYFGQDVFIRAEAKGPLTEKAYLDALARNHRLSRTEGIDAVMDKYHLDAIVAPAGGPAWTIDLVNGDHDTGGSSSPAAVAGYPNICVPGGFVFGLPVGISFFGRAWSEPTLIKLAYAFEQATQLRRAPQFLPTLPLKA